MAHKIIRWNSFTFCDRFMPVWQKWHCHIPKIPLLERNCSTTPNDAQFHWNSYVGISTFYNTIVWDLQEWPEQQLWWIMAKRKFQDQVLIWINWECQIFNQPFLTYSLWMHIRLISKMFKWPKWSKDCSRKCQLPCLSRSLETHNCVETFSLPNSVQINMPCSSW